MRVFRWTTYLFAIIGFVLVAGYFGVRFGWTNVPGIIDNQRGSFLTQTDDMAWAKGEEWITFKDAVSRDIADIRRAAALSGISSRIIVANMAVEQLRLFHTDRELFKAVFAPLKILGNQSQFSWGVMGIKQDTARMIESSLKDASSPFYPGVTYEKLLDFKTADHDSERFARLTDEKSRFYSYLYAGLYVKEVVEQWRTAGYDVSDRPEILSTLFNIGFGRSVPKKDPQVGGAAIDIAGKTYSFGGLAGEFYRSEELIKEFPR
ncbi:MAG: hypothetical protein WC763_03780 [Candidatus Paceibacterota bacterium]|jgi:hypothetical protein